MVHGSYRYAWNVHYVLATLFLFTHNMKSVLLDIANDIALHQCTEINRTYVLNMGLHNYSTFCYCFHIKYPLHCLSTVSTNTNNGT